MTEFLLISDLQDGDVVHCSQCDRVFLYRPDREHQLQMCRCLTICWKIVAHLGPVKP